MSTTEPTGTEPERSAEPETSGATDEVETARRNRASLRKKVAGAAAVGLAWGFGEATGYSVTEQLLAWVFAALPVL